MRDNELRRVRENRVQKRKKLCTPGFVQSVRRLIRDQKPRPGAGCQRDRHALRHAAGELKGILVQKRLRRVKARKTQLFCRQCREILARQAELFQAVIELLSHRARGEQKFRAVLRNINKLVAAQRLQLFSCGKRRAVHLDTAALHPHVCRKKPQNRECQHGLARAGLADDRQPLPGRKRKRNVLQKHTFAARKLCGDHTAGVRERRKYFSCGHRRSLPSQFPLLYRIRTACVTLPGGWKLTKHGDFRRNPRV